MKNKSIDQSHFECFKSMNNKSEYCLLYYCIKTISYIITIDSS